VWVIRPSRARTRRVLASVNPDPEEVELNLTILELAASMVKLEGGELHVVHAWELYGEATMRSSGFVDVSPEELEGMLDEDRAKHDRALADLLASPSVADQPWQVHLVKGAAEEVVPTTVTEHGINLLVMGTVARGGVTAMVMGNTAERVLDNVHCSVIAVKPDGFVSPIQAGG
jgi:nucleotide-binding universal stress UspA family protein